MDLPAGKGLSGLRKLRVLRLDHNHLEWVRAAEIVPLVSLLQLDLSYNRLTAVEGLNSLTGLEELRLASNHLPKLPNISRCQKVYRPHPPPANRVLMHCSFHCVWQLHELDISCNSLDVHSLSTLGDLEGLKVRLHSVWCVISRDE